MWPRLVNTTLGIWLMAAPAVLGYAGPASISDRIVGPIAASVAVVAIWEVTRGLRWINLALGLWLIAAPWLLEGYETAATINSSIAGLLLAILAPLGGKLTQRFGGGWRALWPPCSGRQQEQA